MKSFELHHAAQLHLCLAPAHTPHAHLLIRRGLLLLEPCMGLHSHCAGNLFFLFHISKHSRCCRDFLFSFHLSSSFLSGNAATNKFFSQKNLYGYIPVFLGRSDFTLVTHDIKCLDQAGPCFAGNNNRIDVSPAGGAIRI